MTQLSDAARDYARTHGERFRQELHEMLRIPSLSADPAHAGACGSTRFPRATRSRKRRASSSRATETMMPASVTCPCQRKVSRVAESTDATGKTSRNRA